LGRARVGCRDPPQVRPCRLVCCHPWQHTVPPTHPCPPFDRGLVGDGKSKAESPKQKAAELVLRCSLLESGYSAFISILSAQCQVLSARCSMLDAQCSMFNADADADADADAWVIDCNVTRRRHDLLTLISAAGHLRLFFHGRPTGCRGRGCGGWRDHERHGWRDMSLHGRIHGVSREPTQPRQPAESKGGSPPRRAGAGRRGVGSSP